jgi:PAS domain S-box-containing protein
MEKDQLKEPMSLLLLRKVIESVDDIIVLQDIEGKYIYYNEAPVYGLKSKDVVGKTPFDFFDKDQANKLIDRVKEVFVKGKGLNFETLVKWKGKKIWYNDTMTPLKDDDGYIKAVVTISRNITERKKAEEQFRTLAEQSPNMIFINKMGRIVYVNKKSVEMMGYSKEEFYSKDFDFMILISPESRKVVTENFQRHIRGEEIPPYEYKLLTKEGREIFAIHTTALIEFEGEKAILGIITDISNRKAGEEELRKNIEELEKWQRLTVGREMKMVDLKKEIIHLKKQLKNSE